MKRSFLSLTVLILGLILSSNFSGLVKFSDDLAYAQETSNVLKCRSNFSDSKDIVGCLRSIMNDQTQSPDERYSAHYHLANTYYLDGKYINSYSSLNNDWIKIKTDPSGYRKALSYLLRAENEVLLGEYGKAKKSLTEVFNLINPEPKREKVNLTQDELVTFHLLRGNIYTATAQKLSLDEEKDKKLSDEKEAKSFYKSARSIIMQKFIGLTDQPKQEKPSYPNRIYCKPLEYDQNEIPESLENNILEPFRSLAKKGELDLNDYDKASFKKNAKIGDLFKLLEAVVSLSKNQTYQREFNNQVFDSKRVMQGSYIYDLKCYVNLISSANNFPKEEKTNDPRVEALFYNYLGEAYE